MKDCHHLAIRRCSSACIYPFYFGFFHIVVAAWFPMFRRLGSISVGFKWFVFSPFLYSIEAVAAGSFETSVFDMGYILTL
jgi:hypothetical protein